LSEAGIEEYLPGGVVKLVRVHRPDYGDVVDDFGQVWQFVGQFRTALAMPREAKARPQHCGIPLDKGVALIPDYRWRQRFSLKLFQLGFVVEQFQLTRRPRLKQVNHPFGLGGKVSVRSRFAKRPGQ
tara:strand:- start:242 stop:622 length:381 start_codon:yes stop_codon:yes gene_type:complete